MTRTSKKTASGGRRAGREPGKLRKIDGYRGIATFLFSLSGVINLLALTGAMYMLQIYDRALTSGSIPTLIALSALAIGLYLFQGVFDILRSQILVRLGARYDAELAPLAHSVVIEMPRFGYSTSEAVERGRDVDTIRTFLGGQGPVALFDLPWMPLYLIFIYVLHPTLGLLTLGGALVLTVLTIMTEVLTRKSNAEMNRAALTRNMLADSHARNADILKAMGFTGRAVERFEDANRRHLDLQTRTSDVTGTFSGLSKVMRMMLQSAILGVGAYLTINGELSAGAIIASSIVSARALAPVDLVIGQWKGMQAARRSFKRLNETLASMEDKSALIDLPMPTRSLKLENVTVATPSTGAVLLSEIGFELSAGQALGLIGPSGGGKTSLVRGIVGVWPLLRGSVRLDEADLEQYREEALGRTIGYMPQDVSLLDGTIAENISRFDSEQNARKIVSAAKAAGVHEMIVRLPDGYQTPLGPNGTALSAGQRQRIGLARALYDDPFLVVLDEPNSNLDGEGEAALTAAIKGVRERGGIVIVVAHRPSALAAVDMLGVIQAGRLVGFGPKDQILRGQEQAAQSAQMAKAGEALSSLAGGRRGQS